MFSVARNILLFFVGILLAVLFVYQGGVRAVSALFSSPSEISEQASTEATPRARLKDDLSPQSDRPQLFDSSVSAQRRQQVLIDALREGTIDSFQALRGEYLRELPEYQTELLPALKKEALNGLLTRLTTTDWMDWQNSFVSQNGNASRARLYVEDLKGVNTDIGMFLETAAFLLSGVAQKTEEGKVFDVSEQMSYLLDNAEQLLSARKLKALPARYVFQPDVAADPAFRTVLERERGRLVAQYLKKYPQNMKAALRLLGSLEPRLVSGESYRIIAKYLVYVATGASARLREAFLYADMEEGTLDALAAQDKGVRRALSMLYVLAAVDSLESGDSLQASKFLHQSVAIEPGQRMQRIVAQALKESPEEAARTVGRTPRVSSASSASRPSQQEAPKRQLRDEASVDWILLGGLLAICCAVPLVVIFLLNRYRLKDLRYIEDKLSSDRSTNVPREQGWETGESRAPRSNNRDRLKAVG